MTKLSEKETIPLPSTLILHYQRSEFLVEAFTSSTSMDPRNCGWTSTLDIKYNSDSDPYISIPKKLFQGCYCKSKCSQCKCVKDREKGYKCSRMTCKNCKCFEDDEPLVVIEENNITDEEQSSSDESSHSFTIESDLSDDEI